MVWYNVVDMINITKVFGVIYVITNLVNGKMYVGQTVMSVLARFRRHLNGAFSPNGKDFHFLRAIRLYGKENFQISILCSCSSQEELNLMEDLYILSRDTMNPEKGYNSRRGGANGKFSEESKKRCSASKLGRKHSEESRINRSKLFRGSTHPAFGRKATDETRKKMSENRKGAKSYKYRHDVSTEDLIHLYNTGHSTSSIAAMFSIHDSTVGDRLKKAGINLRPGGSGAGDRSPRFKKEVDSQELARLYLEGIDSVRLGKMFSMTPAAIGQRLKKVGVEMRPKGNVSHFHKNYQ